jgi:retron-type reverse transcriptase
MINSIYESGSIPVRWKVARLILLNKPGKDPRLPTSYRLISILPSMSKFWEYTFKAAIEKELGTDPFHQNPFGFRKGKSTVDAISRVCKFAETCRKRRLVCVLMCVDIKNAFNSLKWEAIMDEARRRYLSRRLTRVLGNYLKDCYVVYESPNGVVSKKIYADVPQGLVVGPLLWNLVYDGLLARFENKINVRSIAFADDLAIMVGLKKTENVEWMLNLHMTMIANWCRSTGLQIAREKTEIIMLTGMRVPKKLGCYTRRNNVVHARHGEISGCRAGQQKKLWLAH